MILVTGGAGFIGSNLVARLAERGERVVVAHSLGQGDKWRNLARLAEAHAMGISHGDLKPANVMVRDDGVVKILDFGLARVGERSLDTNRRTLVDTAAPRGLRGTPAYMSPEQAGGGRASRAGDVFSLGVLLYELLTGTQAFSGATIEQTLADVREVEPERYAGAVAEPFASILRAVLAREARQRTMTMKQIAQRLQEPAQAGPPQRKGD